MALCMGAAMGSSFCTEMDPVLVWAHTWTWTELGREVRQCMHTRYGRFMGFYMGPFLGHVWAHLWAHVLAHGWDHSGNLYEPMSGPHTEPEESNFRGLVEILKSPRK